MLDLIVIIIPQEYKTANHRNLWHAISEENGKKVLLLDIPADFIVTRLKRKYYRLREYRQGMVNIGFNIDKYRPFFFLRPEILPNVCNLLISKLLWKQLKKILDLSEYRLSFIAYHPKWVRILDSFPVKHKLYYYILDEISLNAGDDKRVEKNILNDKYACEKSDHIFVMSQEIKDNRAQYNEKITVIGNGSLLQKDLYTVKYKGTVGFIGNFRDWIDETLLTRLIEYRKDLMFCFVGPIENNMKDYFLSLLDNYCNTAYYGKTSKEEVNYYYKLFDVIIVPYKQNNFMKATRPIKIVESVFAGTPVVTIPMTGYIETDFIKFASSYSDFSEKIDFLLENPIDINNLNYKSFLTTNSWKNKSKIIAEIISERVTSPTNIRI